MAVLLRLVSLAVVLALAGGALAEEAPEEAPEDSQEDLSPEAELKRVDKDGDGKVTEAEILARVHKEIIGEDDVTEVEKFKKILSKRFKVADGDGDGKLGVEELGALMKNFEEEGDEEL